jgi:hypothetical protein
MKKRFKNVRRLKVVSFVLPEIQYLLEQMAIKAGYIRNGNNQYSGRPDIGKYIEDWIAKAVQIDNYTELQRLQMREHQTNVIKNRLK